MSDAVYLVYATRTAWHQGTLVGVFSTEEKIAVYTKEHPLQDHYYVTEKVQLDDPKEPF